MEICKFKVVNILLDVKVYLGANGLRPKNKTFSCLTDEDDWSPLDTPSLPEHLSHLKLYCNSTVLSNTAIHEEFDNIEDDIYVVKNHVRAN